MTLMSSVGERMGYFHSVGVYACIELLIPPWCLYTAIKKKRTALNGNEIYVCMYVCVFIRCARDGYLDVHVNVDIDVTGRRPMGGIMTEFTRKLSS